MDTPDSAPLPGPAAEASRTPTRDGLELAGEHHLLPAPRARLVIVHGFGEHRGRYRRLAGELLAAGFECHLFDLRGHGDSGGRRGHVGHFADYRDDLARFTARAGRESEAASPAPWVLLGHSLGGLIAADYVLHAASPFSALALSSPFLASPDSPPLARWIAAVARRLLPGLRLHVPFPPAALSHDPRVVEAYARDPRVFDTFSPAWLGAVTAAQRRVYERAGEIRLPALVLLGSADRVADPERSRAVFRRLGSPDKTLRVYDGLFHEVLNELDRGPVVADLLAWLGRHALPGPGLSPAG